MEAATVESISAAEAATMESISAAEAATVESSMKAAIKAIPASEAGTKETISVPETKPGAGADEDATCEPVRPVVAIRSAVVRRIVVVAIGADWRGAVIDRTAKSDAEGSALGVRI
jgi:hypothetical protein